MSTVLVVEDETVLQDAYKLILTAAGHTVHSANNGAEALALIEQVQPELVFLDVYMPVMDGREFLKQFDKSRYPKIKIIAYSNLSDPELKQEILDLGAEEFILKSSMAPQDLINYVQQKSRTA